jgi:Protein of unknown function (DUF2465)
MLLKRLDVTIQSFLWGDKVQSRKDEFLSAVQAHRALLTETPRRYDVSDGKG